jgi:hypothetical protein
MVILEETTIVVLEETTIPASLRLVSSAFTNLVKVRVHQQFPAT